MRTHTERYVACFAAVAMALACGGTNDPQFGPSGGLAPVASTHYTIGGTISGLSDTVVLQDNGTDDLGRSTNGPFTFAAALKNQATYAVTVRTQPSGQTCVVANGSGTIAGANVTDVTVSCQPNPPPVRYYTVGGMISGLSGTVVLQDNGGDDLTLSADGSFAFATPLAEGSSYNVTVASQPANQLCTITNGAGTIGSANVTSVAVTCSPTPSVATPTFNPAPGAYYRCHPDFVQSVSVQVTLSDATPGAAIYYTTDGTPPTFASIPYVGPITVSSTTPIRAVAIANGVSSEVTGGMYSLEQANTYGTTADPIFTPGTGSYGSPQRVTLADASAGATVYYSIIDESAAASGGPVAAAFTVYTGEIAVERTGSVEAYASLSGGLCNPSFMSAWYTISQVARPYLGPPPGSYATCDGTLQIGFNDITLGATIYNTLDGTSPTTASQRYAWDGMSISGTTTVRAIAVESGLSDSEVVGGTYSVSSDPSQCCADGCCGCF